MTSKTNARKSRKTVKTESTAVAVVAVNDAATVETESSALALLAYDAQDSSNESSEDKLNMVRSEIRDRLNRAVATRFDIEREIEKTKPNKSVTSKLIKTFKYDSANRVCNVTDRFIDSCILLNVQSFDFVKRNIYALYKVAAKCAALSNGFYTTDNDDKRDVAVLRYLLQHKTLDRVFLDNATVCTIFARNGQTQTDAQVSSTLQCLTFCNVLRKTDDSHVYSVNRESALLMLAASQYDAA